MDRREFLATGASLAIAATGGCTGCARGPSASLRMEPVDDVEIARRVTHRLERDPDAPRYRLVAEAVENGSATVQRTEPVGPERATYVYDGAVYELVRETVDERQATSFQITLNPVDGSVPERETVRFADLPPVDRGKFRERGWVGDDVFLGFGTSLLYFPDEVADSALVPEPERSVIVWDRDTRGRFTVEGSAAVTQKTYRYEARLVDPSAADYGARVRREHVFTLAGLSPAERDLVRTAIEEDRGYTVPADESPPDALYRLRERFAGHEDLERTWEDESVDTGQYLVRYDGEVYWATVYAPERTGTASG
ncbi:MAG: hypothetical protein ABEJ74_00380 [Haloferacaceae archaeon]